MKERPILFNGDMVRAILEGRKTQTRRLIKVTDSGRVKAIGSVMNWHLQDANAVLACPLGLPGDRLWVRETWAWNGCLCCDVHYRASDPDCDTGDPYFTWRPSIHMPRWASRISLEITNVRVERLNEITRGDAMEEGCPFPNMADGPDPREWFSDLWESINGAGSWDANPWVWVIEFCKINGGAA